MLHDHTTKKKLAAASRLESFEAPSETRLVLYEFEALANVVSRVRECLNMSIELQVEGLRNGAFVFAISCCPHQSLKIVRVHNTIRRSPKNRTKIRFIAN